MKTREQIKSIILKIIGSYVDNCDINDDSLLMGDLGLGDLDVIDVIMEIEERCYIEIPDESVSVEKIDSGFSCDALTIGQLVSVVENLLEEAGEADDE